MTSAPNLDAYKAALGEAQKKLAEDSVNAFLFQLPNVTVADAKLKDLTIISHVDPLDIGIYANPNYYFQYDSPAFQTIYSKVTSAPDFEAYKTALRQAQRKLVEDSVNGFLFQLPNVTVANAKIEGLWKNAPIFVNDLSTMAWQ